MIFFSKFNYIFKILQIEKNEFLINFPNSSGLMFGERREGQVVKLRSDGLRSRAIRAEAKRNREEKERKEAETLNKTIDDVAEASGDGERTSEGPSTSSGLPVAGRMMPPNRGNRVYHPPREFHGTRFVIAKINKSKIDLKD